MLGFTKQRCPRHLPHKHLTFSYAVLHEIGQIYVNIKCWLITDFYQSMSKTTCTTRPCKPGAVREVCQITESAQSILQRPIIRGPFIKEMQSSCLLTYSNVTSTTHCAEQDVEQSIRSSRANTLHPHCRSRTLAKGTRILENAL